MESSTWELSKENIQPLKKGRKMDNLQTALLQQADGQKSKMGHDNTAYEMAIDTYEGPDPLEPWCAYIDWSQQNFPSGGKDTLDVLQRCLKSFKDDERYRNDPRLISVFIAVSDFMTEPLALYKYMYDRNIGSTLTEFYVCFALELETTGKMRLADEAYQAGLQCGAEPRDELAQRYRQFLSRMTQVSADKTRNSDVPISEEHRAILGPLKPTGRRHLVGSNRIGNAKLNDGQSGVAIASTHKPLRQQPITVFTDENDDAAVLLPATKTPSNVQSMLPSLSEAAKENERRPAKWNNAAIQSKPLAAVGSQKFEVHVDENAEHPENRCPQKTLEATNALSSKKVKAPDLFKAISSVPQSKIDEFKERYQCCITKVHAKTGEMQFEELRAERWFRKNRTEHESCLHEIKDNLAKAMKAFSKLSTFNRASQAGRSVEIPTLLDEIHNLTLSVGLAGQGLAPPSGARHHADPGRQSLPWSSACESDSAVGSRPSSIGPSTSTVVTPSNNTTNIIRQLWADSELPASANPSKCDHGATVEKDVTLPSPPPDKPQPAFTVFTETSGDAPVTAPLAKPKPSFAVFAENSDNCDSDVKPLPAKPQLAFTVFSDNSDSASSGGVPIKVESSLAGQLPYVPPPPENDDHVVYDENLQNVPPPGYNQTENKRMMAGILQQSVNVEYEPLVKEEILEMDEDMFDGMTPIGPYDAPSDTTFECPTNTGFFQNLRLASTPGRDYQAAAAETGSSKSNYRLLSENQQQQQQQHLPPSDDAENDAWQGQSATRCYTRPVSFGNFLKPTNLSTISETSREYKSSSSSGTSSTAAASQWKSQLSGCSRNKTQDEALLSKIDKCKSLQHVSATTPGQVVSEMSVNPFDDHTITTLLANLRNPLSSMPGYVRVNGLLPRLKADLNICLERDTYYMSHLCAEGGCAKIYKAMSLDSNFLSDLANNTSDDVILKVQQPPCPLEFYISSELVSRLKKLNFKFSALPSIMDVRKMYLFKDASILVTSFHNYGTLLDICNLYTAHGQSMPECLVLYFTIEMLHIVEQIHACGIIHADIKPDNFMLMKPPSATMGSGNSPGGKSWHTQCLKLIDYGLSIDMTLMPVNTTFTACLKTDQFQTHEMQDKRPWTYQIDFFGMAASVYVMLFGHYMRTTKVGDTWKVNGTFKRYWCYEWSQFFHQLLNVPDCNQQPDVAAIRKSLEDVFSQKRVQKDFPSKVRELAGWITTSKR